MSFLANLMGGPRGGTVGGNVIVPGNYDPSKRGTPKVGSGLINPTRNMGPAGGPPAMNSGASAASGGGGGSGAVSTNNRSTNMGDTILPGSSFKTSLTGTSSDVAKDDSWFGLGKLFGGRRRKSRRSKKSKKTRKGKGKRKSHRRRR